MEEDIEINDQEKEALVNHSEKKSEMELEIEENYQEDESENNRSLF